MRSSMLLTPGAIVVALIATIAVASEDVAPVESAVDAAQPVAEAAPGSDPVESADPMGMTAPVADASPGVETAAPAAPAETTEPAAPAETTEPVADASPAEEASADLADAPAPTADSGTEAPAAPDPFLDSVTEPSEAAAAPAAPAPPTEPVAAAVEPAPSGPTLGQIGYDSEGRHGRIHLVVPGDTLWDISNAYLATPWVWPSIWKDNRNIENPHLIYPGDRIWITDSEMRIVSEEEAAKLLAGKPPEPSDEAPPAAPGGEPTVAEDLSPQTPVAQAQPETRRVSELEAVGLVTADVFDASASIVEAEDDKVMLSQGDKVYIGLGAGDVEEGDQFTIFRKVERVFDPDTGRLIGYHVQILGWLTVESVEEEASLASIHQSTAEIERGDRLMPREVIDPEIAVAPSPAGVEGKISFFAQSRTMMAGVDYVYLNRGTLDGVEAGSPLEVYRPGRVAQEPARHTQVQVPDRVIAELLVVKAQPNSSVAYVSHASTELALGDRFRGIED